MITADEASELVWQLKALPGKRDEEELVDQRMRFLAETLMEIGGSLERGRKIVDRCIRFCKFIPTPAELTEQAERLGRESIAEFVGHPKPAADTADDIRAEIAVQRGLYARFPHLMPDADQRVTELKAALEELEQKTEAQRMLASIGGKA